MIGIDLTNIKRFMDKKEPFVKKILHKEEITQYNLSDNKAKFLATHWAIKESLYKNNNKYVQFNKILIKKNKSKYEFQDYNISTSNEDDYIIAIVEKREHWK